MKPPLISVLMSVYNGEGFVARAVLSLLVQSFLDFELIIVNDGSTDATGDILTCFPDPRIQIVEQSNSGLTKSLNRALSLARGKWIARQDADDLSMYSRLEQQLAFLSRNPHVKLLGTSTFVSNSRGLINEVFYYPQSDEEIKRALPFLNPFVHGSVMIDRKLLVACGGYNEKYPYVQDYELWTRIVYETKVANLAAPLYARMRYRSCSEVAVDKEKIVGQIREKLVRQKPELHNAPEPSEYPIRTQSLYPVISKPFPKARLLAEHLLKMSEKGKEFSFPQWSVFLQGMLYCPSACIVKWLRMRRREHATHFFFSHH